MPQIYCYQAGGLSSNREDWIDNGLLLQKDGVYLTRQEVKAAADLIRKAVLYWGDYKNLSATNLAHTILEGTPYSRWAGVFCGTCEYVFLVS